jgi:signal transduction histidine kinase
MRRELGKPRAPDPEKLLKHGDRIAAIISQINHQIEELVNVARLESGEDVQMVRQPVDLPDLLQRIATIQQQISPRHQISVQLPADAIELIGDERQLERVFTNVIMNAVKYSPQGGAVEVTVTVEERQHPPGVLVRVRDEGLGIPANDLPFVFEPYRRGSNIDAQISGSGLGLVSARYVVEQHAGRISVTSVEGQGAGSRLR